MSDSELERIKRQRLAEMQRVLDARKQATQPKQRPTTEQTLHRVFVGRAWEVYQATIQQFPSIAGRLFSELAQLVENGQLTGQITGEQLYGLLRQIGLDVRLDTKIQVLDHGKLKSLGDKFRGG